MITQNASKKFSVLTVDDIPKNLQVLGNILRKENYQVMFASGGEAALSIIGTEKPDLILLDIMMPEMDGYEVCERLKSKKETRDIPIIFLTAKTETEDIIRGFEYGAVDYVTKPFNASELIARVKTHIELKEAKESVTNLMATNSKFFSIMSHDIRNALIGVKGVSKFLIEDIKAGNPENIEKMATLMYDDSSKLFDILENLIEWSNINTGNIEDKPQNLSLAEVTDNVVGMLMDRAEKKNVTIVNNISEELLLKIDLHIINTLLYDIISNSIKYSLGSSAKVEIDASSNNGVVTISIKDNGIGMEKDVVANLFKIDTPHKKAKGTADEIGSGLGLVICSALIQKCGGNISAESEVEEGTTVTIELPEK